MGKLDLKSFMLGFSYDYFLNIDFAAYELSIGYKINKKRLTLKILFQIIREMQI